MTTMPSIIISLMLQIVTPAATQNASAERVAATMSIGGATLICESPGGHRAGDAVRIRVSLANQGDEAIYLMSGIDDRVRFNLCVKSPGGKETSFESLGMQAHRVGNNIAQLKPGETIEEVIDLDAHMDLQDAGIYSVSVRRQINGVVRFPERTLQVCHVPVIIQPR